MNHKSYFRARFLSVDGRVAERLFFVRSMQEVRLEVSRLGGALQSISVHRNTWFNREFYSNEYKIGFLKGLQFHIEAGASAAQGLLQIIEAEPHARKRSEMQPALEVLARGGHFGDALASLPFIDGAQVLLLQTAGAAGSLNEAIADCVAIMEQRGTTWKMIGSAVGWLGFDMFSVVSTVFAVQFYAIPWFRQNPPSLLEAGKAEAYTRSLEHISLVSAALTGLTAFFIAALLAFSVAMVWGSAGVKAWLHRKIVAIPMLRSVFVDGALASGMLILSRMEKSGGPMRHSLALLTPFSWLGVGREFWQKVREALDAGHGVSQAFGEGRLLAAQELSVVATHQNREQLSKVLGLLAQRRREEAAAGTKRFIRLSVVVNVVYMMIAMGLVLWLLDLQNNGISGSFEELMKGGF